LAPTIMFKGFLGLTAIGSRSGWWVAADVTTCAELVLRALKLGVPRW